MNHSTFPTLGPRYPARHTAQRGVSLIFALLALAAMLLAAVALVRSVDSGAIVLGNLGFKQEATQAADRATEVARAWILAPAGVDLNADSPANGYYASSLDNLDPTGQFTTALNKLAVVDWDGNNCASYPAGTIGPCQPAAACGTLPGQCGAQVAARYVITRLCPTAGAVSAANACAKPAAAALSDAAYRGEIRVGAGSPKPEAATTPYYRIIVRTVGGRGAVSFTETVVH